MFKVNGIEIKKVLLNGIQWVSIGDNMGIEITCYHDKRIPDCNDLNYLYESLTGIDTMFPFDDQNHIGLLKIFIKSPYTIEITSPFDAK